MEIQVLGRVKECMINKPCQEFKNKKKKIMD
jgi:hypothetical protein